MLYSLIDISHNPNVSCQHLPELSRSYGIKILTRLAQISILVNMGQRPSPESLWQFGRGGEGAGEGVHSPHSPPRFIFR